MALCLPAIATAQYNGQYPPNNPNGGYNNGGYGNGGYNNGQNGNNGYYGDIRSTLRDLKDRSRNFEKQLDRSPIYSKNGNGNYGNYGGYRNGNDTGYVRKLADRFGDAADRLNSKYGNGRNANNGSNEANEVLNLGSQLEQELYNRGMDGYLQNEWNRIQNDLRVVSNTYGSNYNGGNNRNNRNNRNYPTNYPNNYPTTNGRRNLPSWWPF